MSRKGEFITFFSSHLSVYWSYDDITSNDNEEMWISETQEKVTKILTLQGLYRARTEQLPITYYSTEPEMGIFNIKWTGTHSVEYYSILGTLFRT